MARKLLIIHGYSDGATSFTALRDFFVRSGAYAKADVFLLNYDSLDDESTFEDFADKLDHDLNKPVMPLDVPSTSPTGRASLLS